MEMFVVMDAEVGQLASIQVATVGTWKILERQTIFNLPVNAFRHVI